MLEEQRVHVWGQGWSRVSPANRTKSFRGARSGSGKEVSIFSSLPLAAHLLCHYECISKKAQTMKNLLLLSAGCWGACKGNTRRAALGGTVESDVTANLSSGPHVGVVVIAPPNERLKQSGICPVPLPPQKSCLPLFKCEKLTRTTSNAPSTTNYN